MKSKSPFIRLVFACSLLTLIGCGSDSSSEPTVPTEPDRQPAAIDSLNFDVGQEEIKEIEIPEDEEREKNLNKAAAASPFVKLGCCDEKQNFSSDCCCDEVIEAYRTMVAEKDTSLARLKMTDPILSTCRKKHQNVFDKIDNPVEDYDDMVGLLKEASPDV